MNPTHPPGARLLTAERLRLWREPRARDLVGLLELPARLYPDLVAVHLCEHQPEGEDLTYGQLWEAARVVASRLRHAGLQQGDRVLLALPTSRWFFESFFGVLVGGGVPVPVAPPTSLKGTKFEAYREIINNVAQDSGATVCACLERAATALQEGLRTAGLGTRLLCADAPAEVESDGCPVVRPSPSDTALLQYTSGSTSKPKGVVLGHGNIVANAEAIAQVSVEPDTVCVSWLPLYHDMGLIGAFLTALYCRAPVVLMPPQAFVKDPAAWLRRISEFRGTYTVAPNFAFGYSARSVAPETLPGVQLDSLKTVLNGAEPVDVDAVESFYEKFQPLGLRRGVVRPVYGLAESSLAVTFAEPGRLMFDEVDADLLESEGVAARASDSARSRRLVSVGRPIPTQEVRVVDGRDQPLPERRVGEVVVRGPSLMRGYHNRPEETAETLRGGWLHTGDLGYLAGGELYLTGRSKDLIIRYGRNYYPQDIEKLAGGVEGVVSGGVAAFAVEDGGETLVVVFAETRARKEHERDQIERQIRSRCQDFFLFGPDVVRLVTPGSIPRTTSGKIRRRACKQLYLDTTAALASD